MARKLAHDSTLGSPPSSKMKHPSAICLPRRCSHFGNNDSLRTFRTAQRVIVAVAELSLARTAPPGKGEKIAARVLDD